MNLTPVQANRSTTLLLAGGAAYVGGFAWDIAAARSTARAYNRAHASAAIVPVAAPHALGLGIAGRF